MGGIMDCISCLKAVAFAALLTPRFAEWKEQDSLTEHTAPDRKYL